MEKRRTLCTVSSSSNNLAFSSSKLFSHSASPSKLPSASRNEFQLSIGAGLVVRPLSNPPNDVACAGRETESGACRGGVTTGCLRFEPCSAELESGWIDRVFSFRSDSGASPFDARTTTKADPPLPEFPVPVDECAERAGDTPPLLDDAPSTIVANVAPVLSLLMSFESVSRISDLASAQPPPAAVTGLSGK